MPMKPGPEKREQGRYKTFSRRSALLVGGQGMLLSALIARLYYLQVIRAEEYRMLAEDNRISMRLLAPQRGLIIDRHGEVVKVPFCMYNKPVFPNAVNCPGYEPVGGADVEG